MAPLGLLRRPCLSALIGAALLASASPAQADRHSQDRLPGTRPSWATCSNRPGDAGATGTVACAVWLGWRSQAELDMLLAGQQDPASAGYHRWLSPEQFRERFAP